MTEKNSSGQRLKEVREMLGLKQNEFARPFGLQNKGLSAIENGRSKMGEDHLRVLMEKFNVNPIWILSGVGHRLLNGDLKEAPMRESAEGHKRTEDAEIVTITVDSAGNETIQQVSSQARGSYMQRYLEPEYLRELPTISLPGARWRNGTFRAFEVAGDSMQTTLHPGDLVLAQKLYSWPTEIREGYVHIVVTKDDILVKRVLNRLTETGQLVLQSDNIQYSTQLLDGDEVLEVWIARAYLSSQFTNSRYDTVREISNTQADVAELHDTVAQLKAAFEKLSGEKLKKSNKKGGNA